MTEWISVKDRLPEENKYVLVWKYVLPPEMNPTPINKTYAIGYVRNGKWGVTYPLMWMKLPPPEESER